MTGRYVNPDCRQSFARRREDIFSRCGKQSPQLTREIGAATDRAPLYQLLHFSQPTAYVITPRLALSEYMRAEMLKAQENLKMRSTATAYNLYGNIQTFY